MIFQLCTSLILFLFASYAQAADKPTLLWTFSSHKNIPEITRNHLTQENNYVVQLLIKNLPEYKHEFLYGNVVRIEHELKKNKTPTCYPASSALKQRMAYTYSTSQALFPAPSVILRKELAEKLKNKNKHISLQDLVKNKELRGIIVQARAYGPEIDPILKSKGSHIQRQVLEPFAPNLIYMIQNQRADYTLEYSFVVDDLKAAAKTNDDVVSFPIAEAKPAITLYIACSRTPEGLLIVQKVDSIIRKNILSQEYKESLLATSSGESRAAFEKELDLFLHRRSKHPDIH